MCCLKKPDPVTGKADLLKGNGKSKTSEILIEGKTGDSIKQMKRFLVDFVVVADVYKYDLALCNNQGDNNPVNIGYRDGMSISESSFQFMKLQGGMEGIQFEEPQDLLIPLDKFRMPFDKGLFPFQVAFRKDKPVH